MSRIGTILWFWDWLLSAYCFVLVVSDSGLGLDSCPSSVPCSATSVATRTVPNRVTGLDGDPSSPPCYHVVYHGFPLNHKRLQYGPHPNAPRAANTWTRPTCARPGACRRLHVPPGRRGAAGVPVGAPRGGAGAAAGGCHVRSRARGRPCPFRCVLGSGLAYRDCIGHSALSAAVYSLAPSPPPSVAGVCGYGRSTACL